MKGCAVRCSASTSTRPNGIKFNSNFQWSTTSRAVRDGKAEHITREPEQVKAFRDTWRDGIHSYLTYLRDRLTVARDLLIGQRQHLRPDRQTRTSIGIRCTDGRDNWRKENYMRSNRSSS